MAQINILPCLVGMSREKRSQPTNPPRRYEHAPIRNGSDPVAHGDPTTAYLLVKLRKANRTILRLRACVVAARSGSDEELRAAIAALSPGDLGD